MTRHLVLLAALLAQPQPEPAVLDEDVLDPHGQRRPDPPEGEHHERDQRPVTQADRRGDVDAVEQRPRLGRIQHRRLALAHAVRRAADGGGGVERHDLADNQPVEQVTDGGELLLDRRRRALPGPPLDPGRHMEWLHGLQRGHLVVRTPGQEIRRQTASRPGACAGCGSRRRRTRGSAPPRARRRQRPAPADRSTCNRDELIHSLRPRGLGRDARNRRKAMAFTKAVMALDDAWARSRYRPPCPTSACERLGVLTSESRARRAHQIPIVPTERHRDVSIFLLLANYRPALSCTCGYRLEACPRPDRRTKSTPPS